MQFVQESKSSDASKLQDFADCVLVQIQIGF